MSDSISGTICVIGDIMEFGANNFRKRQLVLSQDDGPYENFVPLQLTKDSCDMIEDMGLGASVTVNYRISGRKWRSPEGEDKYFLDLLVLEIVSNDEVFAESMQDEAPSIVESDEDPF